MTDLSRWDFADYFTAREIALLIYGLNPKDSHVLVREDDPVFRRLRDSYHKAKEQIRRQYEGAADLDKAEDRARWVAELHPSFLHSRSMLEKDDFAFKAWIEWGLEVEDQGDFLEQVFPRLEVIRWLQDADLLDKSIYGFAPQRTRSEEVTKFEQELATTDETVLESIMRRAKHEFFSPSRQRDPKRDTVIDWIKAEMISEGEDPSDNIASAMFTIMKPADHNPRRGRNQKKG